MPFSRDCENHCGAKHSSFLFHFGRPSGKNFLSTQSCYKCLHSQCSPIVKFAKIVQFASFCFLWCPQICAGPLRSALLDQTLGFTCVQYDKSFLRSSNLFRRSSLIENTSSALRIAPVCCERTYLYSSLSFALPRARRPSPVQFKALSLTKVLVSNRYDMTNPPCALQMFSDALLR